jgi:hypothetical protein
MFYWVIENCSRNPPGMEQRRQQEIARQKKREEMLELQKQN